MDPNNSKYIKEALKMQPLSEEEKAQRHILARLYGPIATCKEKTRNGRGYNEELWKKALADEVFREKVANKSLFLELGHPADREETDMRCVCACIPELPKIIDGDLYAYVDILDTDNGRLLKTLCDYGFVPGISSRGSGDIMANDEVDPETFFLETWDIVQLPAVKKARLSVCESLNNNTKNVSKAVYESFKTADKKGKEAMKEACKNLGLAKEDVELYDEFGELLEGMTQDDFKLATKLAKNIGITLVKDLMDYMAKHNINSDSLIATLEKEPENQKKGKTTITEGDTLPGGTPANIDDIPFADESLLEEVDDEDRAEDEVEAEEAEGEGVDDNISGEETTPAEGEPDATEPMILGDFLDQFKDYDKDTTIEFGSVKIGDKEYSVTEMSVDDEEDGKLLIEISCDDSDLLDSDEITIDNPEMPEDAEQAEGEEVTDIDIAAEDVGADQEVIDSVKGLVKQNTELENTVRDLKSAKAVGDAKVEELTEELEKYKAAFVRTSKVASENPVLRKNLEALKEQVTKQAQQITALNESLESAKAKATTDAAGKVKSLNEALNTAKADAETKQNELKTQIEKFRKQALDQAKLVEAYKKKCAGMLEHYLNSKAKMLGVSVSTIRSKLNEQYSFEDIDNVCDNLLSEARPAFTLGSGKAKVQVKESLSQKQNDENKYLDPDGGYEIDDSLLELAGLK